MNQLQQAVSDINQEIGQFTDNFSSGLEISMDKVDEILEKIVKEVGTLKKHLFVAEDSTRTSFKKTQERINNILLNLDHKTIK